MTEQELVAKIEEIQSEYFARMNRDLAPYLKQLNALRAGRLSMDNQTLDERYKAGWANYKGDMNRNTAAAFRDVCENGPRRTLTEVLFGFRL